MTIHLPVQSIYLDSVYLFLIGIDVRAFLFLITVFAFAGSATAQLASENLLLSVPESYKSATNTQKGNVILQEYIPKTESLSDWTEMLSVQTFHGLNLSAKAYRANFQVMQKAVCSNYESLPVNEALEFGFETTVWIQTCETTSKTLKNEVAALKVIRGKEAIYVIQKIFRFDPEPEKMETWLRNLKSTRLCVDGSSDSVCSRFARSKPIEKTTAVTPIFGELFAMSLLPQFREQGTQTRSDTFIRSMILNTDENASWTQRVLLMGIKLTSKEEPQFARERVVAVAESFKQACPSSFFARGLSSGKINSGHEVYAMLASCGTHTMTQTKTATSETTLVLVIRGDRNYYVLQWSERGAPSVTALVPDLEMWKQRITKLGPFVICPEKEGEGAPYPSCFKTSGIQ